MYVPDTTARNTFDFFFHPETTDEDVKVKEEHGTRFLNIDDLDEAVKKMGCPKCIDDAAGAYLRKFCQFSEKLNAKVLAEAEKKVTWEAKFKELKNKTVSPSEMYQKFVRSLKVHT